jgi:hypothetical protein
MSSTKRLTALLWVPWLLGCGSEPSPDVIEPEPWPEIVAEGERVRLATASVEEVCAGTISRLDAELDRVEQALALAPVEDPVDVYMLGAQLLAEQCGPDVLACNDTAEPGRIYVRAELYERHIVHELVHHRISTTPASNAPPLFDEGLAAAHAPPWCPPLPTWDPPGTSAILDAEAATELPEHAEYLGGELLRWLLDVHGPAAVLEFMASLDAVRDATSIREAYLARFGAPLDTELFAHLRGLDEPLPPEQGGCLAPEAPAGVDFIGRALEAQLDCSSPRVHNDFAHPERVYVEWTFEVSAAAHGEHRLLGELPPGTELRIEPCACRQAEGTAWPSVDVGIIDDEYAQWPAELPPGMYRVRWSGPVGATLDVGIEAPCDFVEQDCPGTLVCSYTLDCVEPPANPRSLGESCSDELGNFMGDCDAGLVCVGDWPEDGIADGTCLAYCGDGTFGVACPDGLSCQHVGVCSVGCDPLAQDCEPGWGCAADFSTGAGACWPVGDLGALESCATIYPYCGPGLTCETYDEVDACHGDGWISFSGCCAPICDPDAADPGCPIELPSCEAEEGVGVGRCAP